MPGTGPQLYTTSPLTSGPACTSYTYSDWEECKNGFKTRKIKTFLPDGCTTYTGMNSPPILGGSCVLQCTSGIFSNWSDCVNGKQTRTILNKTPLGCEGEITNALDLPRGITENALNLTRSCTSCTGRIYSNWSDCINGQQERVVLYKTPSGCIGEPQQKLILNQSCNNSVVEQNNEQTKKTSLPLVELRKPLVMTTTESILKNAPTNTEKINEQNNINQQDKITPHESKISKITNGVAANLKRFFLKIKFW